MKNTRNIIAVMMILPIILISGCSGSEEQEETANKITNKTQVVSENSDSQTADKDIDESTPEKIAAVVNNKEIQSKEVSKVQEIMMQRGQKISEKDALEQVISHAILEQKVEDEGIVVTAQEAEAEMKKQLAIQGETLEKYKKTIESKGISYPEHLQEVQKQIAIQNYMDSQIKDEVFDVSEEDIQAIYEKSKTQSEQEIPAYEEAKPQIIAMIKNQKKQQAISDFIEGIKKEAEIEYK